MKLYSQILDHVGRAFGTILRHVRDRPNAPFLFHCTGPSSCPASCRLSFMSCYPAGKDRTGIAAAILSKAWDYSLTRMGREPDREKVLRQLSDEPLFVANSELVPRMLTSRYDTMHAALGLIRDKYGGVEAYVKNLCGLSDDDIYHSVKPPAVFTTTMHVAEIGAIIGLPRHLKPSNRNQPDSPSTPRTVVWPYEHCNSAGRPDAPGPV
ncbi:hypothetical protein JVT61DRAFT_8572 [Boletus reticuloceps]|uniref:Uncharacterized protein n=1 Tax=Boletus reticuloceps TaxID=495285 RepID=A0A8I3AFG9_9AGAM|nr:hypothetical protein JVT61DRAFT_8572 [Boletus reticuloceps]